MYYKSLFLIALAALGIQGLYAQQTTYAELSKKTKGYWEDTLFKGDTFKNITSFKSPKQLTDHSYYLRYEGPGWENQQVGYRIYLDWRNAIDIFGKKVSDMILKQVGTDNYDSYHEDAPWGQDILKVGNALGIGSYGRYNNGTTHHFKNVKTTKAKIINKELYSSVIIDYKGWETDGFKTNLKSTISIDNEDVTFKVQLKSSDPIDGLSTGIKVFKQAPIFSKKGTKWAYIATYGPQTLVNDSQQLGMVIFYRLDQLKELKKTKDDHLIIFKDGTVNAEYYAGAAWDQQLNGIKTKAEFESFVNRKLNQLDNPDYSKWSVRFMEDEMQRFPDPTILDFVKKPKWNYTNGLVCKAALEVYEKTKDERFFNYAYRYADHMIEADGTIKTYKIENYNIDMLNAGKILFKLYEKTKEDRFLIAMQTLRSQLENHPRTSDGGFWHKKRYTSQMWLDGLYMGHPFYAQYAKTFESGTAQAESYNDIIHQFDLVNEHHLDASTGLLYHGWDESKQQKWANKETGTSPEFWSRAMGWYAMAIVDVLDFIPEGVEGRDRLISYLDALSTSLKNYQDSTGLWYQVVDKAAVKGNYLEASGTAMFAYAIAKGVNKGYLSVSHMKTAELAYNGLINELIRKGEGGLFNLTQVCAVAGLGGNPYRDGTFDYYINETIRSNDPKGTGPFILLSLELNK